LKHDERKDKVTGGVDAKLLRLQIVEMGIIVPTIAMNRCSREDIRRKGYVIITSAFASAWYLNDRDLLPAVLHAMR
jgi:hypothetical protein